MSAPGVNGGISATPVRLDTTALECLPSPWAVAHIRGGPVDIPPSPSIPHRVMGDGGGWMGGGVETGYKILAFR